ncbi:MAG: glycosyl hyrolase, family 3 [Rhizobium sp.]|nr:glycosyl hyrolase, family 3 [Rhizobium sp.]
MSRKSRSLSIAIAGFGLLLAAMFSGPSKAEEKNNSKVSEQLLRRMIGQMVLVGFSGDSLKDEGYKNVLKQAENGEITGVIYLKRNIKNERTVQSLNNHLQAVVRDPLLISIDQEGGRIQRLTNAIGFKNTPSAAKVASTMNEAAAYEVYSELAGDLAALGFNLNFGPVVDLNINPANPIIGSIGRSYSADPQEVIKYATAFVQAHRVNKVLTALKHFPGHGSSIGDSHKGSADVTKTWNEAELDPYKALIAMGDVDMIMSSHVINRKLSKGAVPSSLSRATLTTVLRGNLHFEGVVISDDMQMDAIASTRSFEDSVRQAVLAGNDILVFANDKHPDPLIPEKIAKLLVKEANENDNMLSRIKESYFRIVALKKKIAVAAVDTVKTKSIDSKKSEMIVTSAMLESMSRHSALTLNE